MHQRNDEGAVGRLSLAEEQRLPLRRVGSFTGIADDVDPLPVEELASPAFLRFCYGRGFAGITAFSKVQPS
jgi:hypothetical protein